MAKRIYSMDNGFNEWARKFNVSMYWQEDTFEKKEFIKKLREARFAFTSVKVSDMGDSK